MFFCEEKIALAPCAASSDASQSASSNVWHWKQLLLAQGEAAKPLNLELFRLLYLNWPIQVGISLYSEQLESL
jgi:hypothetical protein